MSVKWLSLAALVVVGHAAVALPGPKELSGAQLREDEECGCGRLSGSDFAKLAKKMPKRVELVLETAKCTYSRTDDRMTFEGVYQFGSFRWQAPGVVLDNKGCNDFEKGAVDQFVVKGPGRPLVAFGICIHGKNAWVGYPSEVVSVLGAAGSDVAKHSAPTVKGCKGYIISKDPKDVIGGQKAKSNCMWFKVAGGKLKRTTKAAATDGSTLERPPEEIPIYRYLGPGNDHFYTADPNEIGTTQLGKVGKHRYRYEGVAFTLLSSVPAAFAPYGGRKVYRLWNGRKTDHFYTTNKAERDNAIAKLGYKDEGFLGFGFANAIPGGTTEPVFRYYGPGSDHFYTTSEAEIGTTQKGTVGKRGYRSEGVLCNSYTHGAADLEGKWVLVQVRKSYAAARRHCRETYGTDLAVIQNGARNKHMWRRLKKAVGFNRAFFGFDDRHAEGKFHWADGRPRSFTAWRAGEPNNHRGGEDCAEMGFFGNELWNDISCGAKLYFFCAEAPVLKETGTFALVKGRFDWQKANDYCAEHYGTGLASPDSQGMNDAMNAEVNRLGADANAWIGANDRRARTRWEEADSRKLKVRLFAPGNPRHRWADNCAQIGHAANGRWNDADCNSEADGFFCSRQGCPNHCPVCTVGGDPHYKTFDGLVHHFQGRCAYHYVTDCRGSTRPKQVPFDLVGGHRPAGRFAALDFMALRLFAEDGSLAQEIRLLNGFKVQFAKGGAVPLDKDIHYDKARPARFFRASRTHIPQRLSVRVFTGAAIGFDLDVEAHSHVSSTRISIAKAWAGKICGLCGYFDLADSQNDLAVWDGTALKFVPPQGLSTWGRISPEGWARTNNFGDAYGDREIVGSKRTKKQCLPPAMPHNPKCFAAAEKLCEKLYAGNCCAKVAQEAFVEECAFDACAQCEQKAAGVRKCVEKADPLEACRGACAEGADYDKEVLVTGEKKLARNTRYGTFTPSDNYEVSFSLKPLAVANNWHSVFHIGGTSHQRWPGIWLYQGNRLHMMSSKPGFWNRNVCGPDMKRWPVIAQGAFHDIKFGAYERGNTKLFVNGKLVCESPAKDDWSMFRDAPVFAGDPWFPVANAQMRNLVLTRWAGGRPAKATEVELPCARGEHELYHGFRCGAVSSEGNYEVLFEVKPQRKVRQESSILHVGRDRACGLPQVTFSGNQYKLVVRTRRGNAVSGVGNLAALAQDKWTRVRIGFYRHEGVGTAKVYVDGELRARIRKFDWIPVYDAPVYMASPWKVAAGALVRHARVYTWKDGSQKTICGMAPPVFYTALSACSLSLVAVLALAVSRRKGGVAKHTQYGA